MATGDKLRDGLAHGAKLLPLAYLNNLLVGERCFA